MRRPLVAGNWKMNCDKQESAALIAALKNEQLKDGVEVMVAPTFVNLAAAVDQTASSKISVAAQNMNQHASGAYTGEISGAMLKSVGVDTVILGHSERRAYFGEDEALLAEKVKAALAVGLQVIFCFGEVIEDRRAGKHFDVVAAQLKGALYDLEESAYEQIVLAYEPVWAIGTGETATPEQAQEMHAYIRSNMAARYNDNLAQNVTILYGGSVKPNNAAEIFGQPDVDGGLIGGASLKADSFTAIVNAFPV
ncbi:triose-phosphate isomerase [Gilvibacter sp. SZ-19]|uniref:triose-phosphate isomerase n=1 Tax=Gilvibacter sp. SZ-19 TaxID=754429 RepID=UPI000B3BEA42|nr:triose-phosphate isomerase [Gilvibacter sp. SZ-19]ARV13573.1 triose-phosphate isomerase [Gilvibacter sp. SZ-19]